jgi:hypothetical protein
MDDTRHIHGGWRRTQEALSRKLEVGHTDVPPNLLDLLHEALDTARRALDVPGEEARFWYYLGRAHGLMGYAGLHHDPEQLLVDVDAELSALRALADEVRRAMQSQGDSAPTPLKAVFARLQQAQRRF